MNYNIFVKDYRNVYDFFFLKDGLKEIIIIFNNFVLKIIIVKEWDLIGFFWC